MAGVSYDDITRAAEAIRGHLVETPQARSVTLSEFTGADIVVKFENLQFTASFKERGALNRLLALSDEEKAVGVVAVSAGNHAQGVAYHARRMGIPATIVMPSTTPFVKIQRTEEFGARVVLEGKSFSEAAAATDRLVAEENLTSIHPFDDMTVIAGQGTVALEMVAAFPRLEVLIVPIGGGGLISGMAIAAKHVDPRLEVIGVQAAHCPSMYRRVRGETAEEGGSTIADGIAVKNVGEATHDIVREYVDDIVLVSEEKIEHAICLYLTIEKTLAEGAGAAGLAAVLADRQRFAGRCVGVVLSGGNIDHRLLASVLLRNLFREGRLARLHIVINDAPGELGRLTSLIGLHGANIVEVAHQRTFSHHPAKEATVEVAIETRDRGHTEAIMSGIVAAGYSVQLLGNEGPSQ